MYFVAGSKIRFISMLHMAWELLSILSGYSILKVWAVRTPVDRFMAGQ